jgi:hypothetical protein
MSFEEAVMRFSADSRTVATGGDLGTILVTAWNPQVADALDDLQPGEVSRPVVADGETSVLLLTTDSGEYDGTSVDWTQYSESYLAELARSVAFQNEYSNLTDSLRGVIPVIYMLGSDED